MLLVASLGALSGLALGLTGAGGSIITMPLLVYGLGMPVREAIVVSLLVVGMTALVGVIGKWRHRELDWKVGFIVASTGMLAAPLGTKMSLMLSAQELLIGFGLLMTVVSLLMWRKAEREERLERHMQFSVSGCHYSKDGRLVLSSMCQSALFASGAATGFLTGLFGIGGGFLIVPALVLTASLPIKKAVATSLFVIVIVSISGAVSHLSYQLIDWRIITLFAIGGSVGMLMGIQIAHRLPAKLMQKGFAVIILLIGLTILVNKLFMILG